jgi:signal transduction histidine kinase
VLSVAGGTGTPSTVTRVFWCTLIVSYSLYRTVRPLRYRDDMSSLVALYAEVALHVMAVVATGYWESPFVFSLLTAIIVAGFSRGFAFSLRIAVASSLAVGVPDLARVGGDPRVGAQWATEFVLVALVAGYARRISGEADRQQTLALDRLGRLADANALLFSLHRVAQSLPASLDFDEVLDSTMGRLRDLFDFSAAAVLLYEESDRSWTVARREGIRLPARLDALQIPPPLNRVLAERSLVHETNLLSTGGPGLSPQMYSGIYTVLLARGSVIGMVALEKDEPFHYTTRDGELLTGFAEPAALAIDNARWFGRLRTVGAEEERTRIARDLHDRIGQSLAYLAFELDRIVKADTKGGDVGPSLEQLRSDLRDLIREVRDTLYDLRTDVSEEHDMAAVLQLYVARIADRSGLDIAVLARDARRLPLLQERELFRIAQEALANIEKHAEATRVTITWRSDGRTGVLEITDDGRGFPIGRAGRLDSYGIIGMRERAASIGAVLDVDSEPGLGTRVRCVVAGVKDPRAPIVGSHRSLA